MEPSGPPRSPEIGDSAGRSRAVLDETAMPINERQNGTTNSRTGSMSGENDVALTRLHRKLT
jgi:hypothetical protein